MSKKIFDDNNSEDFTMDGKYDLCEFINTETKTYNNGDINLLRIYRYYYKCLSRIIYEIYEKIQPVEDINIYETITYGINMVYTVFWILYSYSLNIKLTMFLTERAVLLFTEFIIMSKNPMLSKEFRFMPNTTDAIAFSIKKTCGPLTNKCGTKNKKFIKELNKYKQCSINLKYINQQLMSSILINRKKKTILEYNKDSDIYNYDSKYINSANDITTFLDTCSSAFSITMLNWYEYDKLCFDILNKFFNDVNSDLTNKVFDCKMFLDIVIEINIYLKDINSSIKLVHHFMNNNENFLLKDLKIIKKNPKFKLIIKKIKNSIKNKDYLNIV